MSYFSGAKMVFIGRPFMWGLAHSGQAGVEAILGIFQHELLVNMQIMGALGIQGISRDMLKVTN